MAMEIGVPGSEPKTVERKKKKKKKRHSCDYNASKTLVLQHDRLLACPRYKHTEITATADSAIEPIFCCTARPFAFSLKRKIGRVEGTRGLGGGR